MLSRLNMLSRSRSVRNYLTLATRMVGFALCVVGAFVASYYDALKGTADMVDGFINSFTAVGIPPSFYTSVTSQMDVYISQNVTPIWVAGTIIGIAIAAAGVALVAYGDGKQPAFAPPKRAQPLAAQQRD